MDGLRAARLVTVTGPGGVGKTRLALQVARELDGGAATVGVVDLSELEDPERVPTAFAEATGSAGAHSDPIDDAAVALADLQALLVVDNCEHVQDAAASVILALLERCPRLRVLATSRETLRLPGELVWALGPLTRDGAVELFVERAEALRPGAGSRLHDDREDLRSARRDAPGAGARGGSDVDSVRGYDPRATG